MSGRVLDLIGHANRANVLPVEYYERPVPVAGPDSYGLKTSPTAGDRP